MSFGGIAVEFEPAKLNFEGFGTLLSADMKIDLPNYFSEYAAEEVTFRSVADIVAYNEQDTLIRIPYGQARFEGILAVDMSPEDLVELKIRLHEE